LYEKLGFTAENAEFAEILHSKTGGFSALFAFSVVKIYMAKRRFNE